MRNAVNLLIALGIFVAGCSVAYYFGIILPKDLEEKRAIEVQKNQDAHQIEQDRILEAKSLQSRRELCISQVDTWFSNIDTKNITNFTLEILLKERDSRKDNCSKEYPAQ